MHFNRDTHGRRLAASPILFAAFLGLVAGCSQLPSDPESRTVRILTERGFQLVSDGRGTDAASVMSYNGPVPGKIECSSDGSSFSTAIQDFDVALDDVPFNGRQTGTVSAQVVVNNEGTVSGLFVNAIKLEYIAGDKVLGSRTEVVEMRPGEAKRLSNGQLCRPKL